MMLMYVTSIGMALFIGVVIGSVTAIDAQNKAHDELMKFEEELYKDETV